MFPFDYAAWDPGNSSATAQEDELTDDAPEESDALTLERGEEDGGAAGSEEASLEALESGVDAVIEERLPCDEAIKDELTGKEDTAETGCPPDELCDGADETLDDTLRFYKGR